MNMVVLMNTTTTIGNGASEPNVIRKLRRPEAEERERILAEWAATGKSVGEMAAATGWSAFTLYRWRHEAGRGRRSKARRKRMSAPSMLVVPKPTSPPASVWAAEVAIGGISLRLATGCPASWAAELVRELRPC